MYIPPWLWFRDPGEIGTAFAVYGALVSGVLVLVVGALVIVAKSSPAFLTRVVVSAGTYLGMLAAVNAGYGGAGGFFLVQVVAIVVVALTIGLVLGPGGRFIRGATLVVVSGIATLCGLASLFGSYFSSADICIGYFGVVCGSTGQIKWLRFSVLAGIGPSLIAMVPAVLAGAVCRESGGSKAISSGED